MPLKTGAKVPTFSVQAVGSGRTVTPQDLAGRGVVVVHGAKTMEFAKDVSKAVRSAFPTNADVFLMSVVDLRSFSGMWKKVAEAQIKSTYEKLAAKAVEAGSTGEREVVILPDWDGVLAQMFGVVDGNAEAAALVFHEGKLRARFGGSGAPADVVASLTKSVGT